MNGYADFIYTPHGWRCVSSMELSEEMHATFSAYDTPVYYSKIHNELYINGKFKHIPKGGQWCKRPDLLIDWSKS